MWLFYSSQPHLLGMLPDWRYWSHSVSFWVYFILCLHTKLSMSSSLCMCVGISVLIIMCLLLDVYRFVCVRCLASVLVNVCLSIVCLLLCVCYCVDVICLTCVLFIMFILLYKCLFSMFFSARACFLSVRMCVISERMCVFPLYVCVFHSERMCVSLYVFIFLCEFFLNVFSLCLSLFQCVYVAL